MARIPDEQVARLKREVSIERLVEAAGIELKPHGGSDRVGRCPFHDDRTPSLVVSPEKNLWHCLGACGIGGSVIDWVMRFHKVSFRHACELLLKDHPALAAGTGTPPAAAQVRRAASRFSLEAGESALLEQVTDFYHQTLLEAPEALAYLDKRGLNDPALIERFRLGYANRTLGYRLPPKNLKAGKEMRGALQELGVLRKSGHEHLTGSLVVPVLDEAGQVVQLYGRKLNDNLRKGTAYHLYLPGPHRGVFNRQNLAGHAEIILCESLIDALTFVAAGFENVTASYGVNGFTDEILATLKDAGAERILIAFDADEAGNRAAEKVAEKLAAEGLDGFRLTFPKGMDANEYAVKVQPPLKSLGLVIRKAEWLGCGRGPQLVVGSSELGEGEDCGKAELQATDRVAAQHQAGADDLPGDPDVPEGGDLCAERSASAGRGVDPLEHRRRPGEAAHQGVPAASVDRQGLSGGSAHAAGRGPRAGLSESSGSGADRSGTGRDRENAGRADQQPADTVEHSELPTANCELPARAIPESPEPEVEATVTDRDVTIAFGDRRYRIRGLDKNTSFDVLKINLLISRGEALHVDTFDLYSAKHRQAFARLAAAELELEDSVIQRELGKVLLKCEELQEHQIEDAMKPKLPAEVEMPDDEREAALALLRARSLVDHILSAFEAAGLVGEPVNALVGYLAAVSRKLTQPLAIIVQSTSAAGKSALMDAILDLVPSEDRIHYSAMTGQSLFYLGEHDLKHKILGIAEEEGVRQASYALKLLQSQGELTIASTGKDPQTGKLVTEEYRVEGPVMLLLTTTAIDIDEELLNRCLVLTVDESRDQTRRIQARQRAARTLDGLLAGEQAKTIRTLHRNAQRLLKPLAVVNPYAERLTFLDERTRTRRDHQKYLTLIDAIALLHQHQREIKTAEQGGQRIEYVEVEPGDIALANRLAHEVLGRSLDELPPQTRQVLGVIGELVAGRMDKEGLERPEVRLTRWDIRQATGLSETRLRLHLDRLLEMEYLLAHAGRQGRRYVYELLFDGDLTRNQPRLPGLIDIEALFPGGLDDGQLTLPCLLDDLATTPTSPGSAGDFAPGSPAVQPPFAPASLGSENDSKARNGSASSESTPDTEENAHPGTEKAAAPDRSVDPAPARSFTSLAAKTKTPTTSTPRETQRRA